MYLSRGIRAPAIHVRGLLCPPHLYEELYEDGDAWQREWEETRGRLIIYRRKLIRRAISIDGSFVTGNQGGGGGSNVVTGSAFTTSLTNDIVVACITYENASATVSITSVVDNAVTGAIPSFTKRKTFSANTNSQILDIWWSTATNVLSGVQHLFQANFNTSIDAANIAVFAVNGANTTTPFDPNASLPATNQNTGGQAPSSGSISTTSATALVFGLLGVSQANGQSAGSGYTLQVNQISDVQGQTITLSLETKIISSPISSTSQAYGSTSFGTWGVIWDAIQAPITLQGAQNRLFM